GKLDDGISKSAGLHYCNNRGIRVLSLDGGDINFERGRTNIGRDELDDTKSPRCGRSCAKLIAYLTTVEPDVRGNQINNFKCRCLAPENTIIIHNGRELAGYC